MKWLLSYALITVLKSFQICMNLVYTKTNMPFKHMKYVQNVFLDFSIGISKLICSNVNGSLF